VLRVGNKDLQTPGEAAQVGGVTPVSYNAGMPGHHGGPGSCPMPCAAGPCMPGMAGPPHGYIAGVTAPQYGMPMSGTPIGLPGPPHIPLGVPAGLQKHTVVNHTKVHLPDPTADVRIDVKQRPGYSYPEPVSHVRIVESTSAGIGAFHGRHGIECAQGPCPEGPNAPCVTGVPAACPVATQQVPCTASAAQEAPTAR
jgi:hypothetical protein